MEALGVEKKFGTRAYHLIVSAIESLYQSTFPNAYLETGPFSQSLMRDVVKSMSNSPDPRDWIRLHATRALRTKDPDDELFHLSLGNVFTNGQPMAVAVEQAA